MRRRARLAVLGAGSWTCVNHLPAIEGRDDVEFVACADTLADRREHVKERFGFPIVTADADEALRASPDAVIVGATPDAHYGLVAAALDAGAHVLCEKPFTMSADEAWSLVRMARSKGRHLVISFGWNYIPLTAIVKQLLDDHGIGTLEHVQVHMATAFREMYQATMPVWGRPPEFLPVPSSYTKLDKGAGYTQAQLSHALGLLLYLVPLKVERVFALMNTTKAEVDLHAAISLEFEGGATCSLSGACCPLGANENKHQLEIRMFGSEGQLILDYDREFVWLSKGETEWRPEVQPGAGTYQCDGPPNALIDLALGADESTNRSRGELGAESTGIVRAAYDSWSSSTVVEPDATAAAGGRG